MHGQPVLLFFLLKIDLHLALQSSQPIVCVFYYSNCAHTETIKRRVTQNVGSPKMQGHPKRRVTQNVGMMSSSRKYPRRTEDEDDDDDDESEFADDAVAADDDVTEGDEDEKDGLDDRPPGGMCHRPVTHRGEKTG